MRKTLPAAVVMVVALVSYGLGAGIADIKWDESNIQKLRSLDESAVAAFLTQILGNFSGHGDCECVKPKDIGQFTWADLAGDGRYELVTTLDVNGRAFFNALVIFRRDSSGKVICQAVDGWGIDDLDSVIRDLDGDGKKELIIPTLLISDSTADTFTWPAVYRLENGKYVQASHDFAGYYDTEVLPELEKEIEEPNGKTLAGLNREETKAVQIMEKAKILRVIGRDPTAGLKSAYEWMNSDDPNLLQDAAATFQNVGGHQKELRAAREALERTRARDRSPH